MKPDTCTCRHRSGHLDPINVTRMRVWKQSYNNLEIASKAAAFKVRCTSANLAMDGLRETRQLEFRNSHCIALTWETSSSSQLTTDISMKVQRSHQPKRSVSRNRASEEPKEDSLRYRPSETPATDWVPCASTRSGRSCGKLSQKPHPASLLHLESWHTAPAALVPPHLEAQRVESVVFHLSPRHCGTSPVQKVRRDNLIILFISSRKPQPQKKFQESCAFIHLEFGASQSMQTLPQNMNHLNKFNASNWTPFHQPFTSVLPHL